MKFIKYEEKNFCAHVELNRPDVRNAFNAEMIAELTQIFKDKIPKSQVRWALLTGAGESFCAGADLNWMKSMVNYTFEENQKDTLTLFDMFQAIADCPVPVVTRVQGHAMGGGLGLMACSDIVVSEPSAQFAFSEVRLGLAPAVISTFVFTKSNHSGVKEYMLTGLNFDSKTAATMGLVNFVGTSAELDEKIKSYEKAFKGSGPEAVKSTKILITQVPQHEDRSESRGLTTQIIAERRVSDEGQEGLKSFLEKRDPKWRLK